MAAGLLELNMYGRTYDPDMGPYHPRIRQDVDHEPQSNLKSASGVGISKLLKAVSTWRVPVFLPGLLEL